ncbi:glycosyltransferase [Cyanobium sp. T1G-Tous]|nr:glycosyltransferase [Cyanobium sp. T1G-Tous]
MPCFNPGAFLQEAVASVLAQPECLELIVAEGCSTDGSLEVLQGLASADARLRIIPGPDQGPADALNKAFAQARGTLIGWLNADDLSPPGALGRAAQALSANPRWLMVYGEGEEFDAATGTRQRYPTLQPVVGLGGFRSHCFICQPTVVFRRTMGLLLGPFDLKWRTAFDFDYWLRAFAAFPDRIGYLPNLQGLTRLHASTITSRQRAQVALEATALLARHFGSAPPTRLHAYALELQLGLAELPAGCSLSGHLAEVFGQAKPWISPVDLCQLRCDWLLDQRTAIALQAAEQVAAEAALFSRPTAALLQIVQPHLRPQHPGPPAGPHLRLQAAFAQCASSYPLLQQESALQRWIERRAHGGMRTPLPFGVNLIHAPQGSVEADLWLQALLAALRAARVPLALCEPLADPGPYAINLIALPPPAHAEWLLARGLEPQLDRLGVAAWPWIASDWPDTWQPLLALVDEIWAPSGLVFQALSTGSSPPVWPIPPLPWPANQLAINPAPTADVPCLLLHVDGQVSPHLLNTFGAVDVFRRAFPAPSSGAASALTPSPQLQILVEHADASAPEWQWLQACSAHDSCMQVRVLAGSATEQLLPLMAQAHGWLSLQRSYAFPSLLGTAQAMGLQVIATASGAALDLQASANLQLVPARQSPIGRGAFPDAEGCFWGEPDRDAAIAALQRAISINRIPQLPSLDEERVRSGQVLKDRLLQLWKTHQPD